MNIKEYVKPESLSEAFEILKDEGNVVLGGGVFLHMGSKKYDKAIDLQNIGLRFIEDRESEIEIGAMTTLRDLETSELLNRVCDGVLSKTATSIMGVQLRNAATLGGTVWGKYGFSDIITTLLALEAEVVLYGRGKMSLERFLEEDIKKDILTSVIIKKDNEKGAFSSLRLTELDYPVLNTAVVKRDKGISICVGGRPARAKYAIEAMEFINKTVLTEEAAIRAGEIVSEELGFGNDLKASEEYRKEVCKSLVKRCIMEVL